MSKSLGYRSLYFFPNVAFKKSKNFFSVKNLHLAAFVEC